MSKFFNTFSLPLMPTKVVVSGNRNTCRKQILDGEALPYHFQAKVLKNILALSSYTLLPTKRATNALIKKIQRRGL